MEKTGLLRQLCDISMFFFSVFVKRFNIPCGDSGKVLHTPIVPQLPEELNSRATDMD
jgi:hypothetical protein